MSLITKLAYDNDDSRQSYQCGNPHAQVTETRLKANLKNAHVAYLKAIFSDAIATYPPT
jgi:hypothetical protein